MSIQDNLTILVEAALCAAATNAGPSDISVEDYAVLVEGAAESVESEIARLRDGLRQAQECCARPPGVCFNQRLVEDGATR